MKFLRGHRAFNALQMLAFAGAVAARSVTGVNAAGRAAVTGVNAAGRAVTAVGAAGHTVTKVGAVCRVGGYTKPVFAGSRVEQAIISITEGIKNESGSMHPYVESGFT